MFTNPNPWRLQMIESIRDVVNTLRAELSQLDHALVAALVDKKELPSLPMATALVELAKAQERLSKTAARVIELARTPPREPELFDNTNEAEDDDQDD